ncbi:MAG TPA: hypothetical protein VLL52_15450 [Anaerolineae bacterium]|nr:hypothetical protein [Anaerolineae bacterium]
MNYLLFLIVLIVLYLLFREEDEGSESRAGLEHKLLAAEAKSERLEAARVQLHTENSQLKATTEALAEEKKALDKKVLQQATDLEATEARVKELEEALAAAEKGGAKADEGEGETASSEQEEVVVVEPEPGPEVEPEPEPEVPAEPDDLRRIEGIGPKFASLLNENGVMTFAQLAALKPEKISEFLASSGAKRLADPASWPDQAALAAKGDWEGLEALQEKLKGGRYVD